MSPMLQIIANLGPKPALHHQATGGGVTGIERIGPMFAVKRRGFYRFLKADFMHQMPNQKGRLPLILLVPTRCATGKIPPTGFIQD